MSLNILLTRIDNRLIHGQVGVTWTTALNANLLVVVDDLVAEDPIQQQLMTVTAKSSGAETRFFTIQKMIDVIHKASDRQKIFIICRTPETVRKLIEGGVPIEKVNVGNMHFSPEKKQISAKVFVNEKDMKDLQFIKSKNVEVTIQDVPSDNKKNI